MVVRAGVTPKPAIENALRAFDSSRLLGIVLNDSGHEQDYRYEATQALTGDRGWVLGARETLAPGTQLHASPGTHGHAGFQSQRIGERADGLRLRDRADLGLDGAGGQPPRRLQRPGDPGAMLWKIAIVTALCELCFYYNDLYDLTVVHSNRELVVRLLQAAGAATIVLAAACLAFPTLLLDPSTFVTALGVFVVAVLTWRIAFNRLAHDPHLEERLLIVGTGADGAQAGAADRPAAGLRLPPRRLRRRDRRRVDGPPARRPRLGGRHRSHRRDPPRRPHRRRPVGPPRPAADRAAAARQDVGRPRRGRDDDLRAADRQDPARRSQTELADLLRRLPRVARDAVRQADARPVVVDHPRHRLGAVHGADGDRDQARLGRARCSTARSGSARTAGSSRSTSSARCGPTPSRPARRSGRATTTTASPASAASSARRGSTSCRSSGT